MVYETFNNVKNENLKSYNRVVMFHNIMEEWGEVQGKEYLNMFSDKDRLHMIIMNRVIKEQSEDEIKRLLTLEVEPEGEELEGARD